MCLSVNADYKLIFRDIHVLIRSLYYVKKKYPKGNKEKTGHLVKVGCILCDDGIWEILLTLEHKLKPEIFSKLQWTDSLYLGQSSYLFTPYRLTSLAGLILPSLTDSCSGVSLQQVNIHPYKRKGHSDHRGASPSVAWRKGFILLTSAKEWGYEWDNEERENLDTKHWINCEEKTWGIT